RVLGNDTPPKKRSLPALNRCARRDRRASSSPGHSICFCSQKREHDAFYNTSERTLHSRYCTYMGSCVGSFNGTFWLKFSQCFSSLTTTCLISDVVII
ncbi:Hypothetical protein CINCED_3A007291, partial [Cinara cedri]